MAITERAIFLDKDGTLVENVPYNVDPERVVLADGAIGALQRLSSAGYSLYVVSNQSGLGRGLFDESHLAAAEERLRSLLGAGGVDVDGFYYCPHHPEARVPRLRMSCGCRKPAPGMVLRACREHNLSAADSWLIGDILDDVEAGRRAGCRTILIDNGNETEWRLTDLRVPHYVAANLGEASRYILSAQPAQQELPRQEGTKRYEQLTA